ncbi:MAG TPA: Hpt domain-containing protein [Solirubrobacteraceae bacterium]|nr:Hpt domain-containing protein [Solirubrobacteraceae bacterium]
MSSVGKNCTALIDRETFDDFADLFNAAELREVIEEWHADCAKALDAIAQAQAEGDSARIGQLAHRAAGGGMALGATALARTCERLRAAAESGAPVTDEEIAPVREAVEATYTALADAAADSQ